MNPQALGIKTPVISHCGALIRNGEGNAFGTLCHYDAQRCQERTTDQPLLAAATQLLYERLHPKTRHPAPGLHT